MIKIEMNENSFSSYWVEIIEDKGCLISRLIELSLKNFN